MSTPNPDEAFACGVCVYNKNFLFKRGERSCEVNGRCCFSYTTFFDLPKAIIFPIISMFIGSEISDNSE